MVTLPLRTVQNHQTTFRERDISYLNSLKMCTIYFHNSAQHLDTSSIKYQDFLMALLARLCRA